MKRAELLAIGLALSLAATAARAEPGEADPGAGRLEALERRVAELEGRESDPGVDGEDSSWLPAWTRRVRISGSASVGYFHRGDESPFDSHDFQVRDARFFIDAELLEDVSLLGVPLVRNVGFTAEWDLVRIGTLQNQVGELFVDFQGIAESSWINAQLGRFQIPVGENYLRFSRGHRDNPFISNTVGGPWWWDEGVRVYGQDRDGLVGYVTSVASGETPFSSDANDDPHFTLKLFTDPVPWLHLSVSGLVSGEAGSLTSRGSAALWLGEAWGRAFGAGTGVPNFVDGVNVMQDGPNVLQKTWFVGADAIVKPCRGVRIWLAWGHYEVDSRGGNIFDRDLQYWVAEVVSDLGFVSPALKPLYVGVRANGLTTADDDRGYLLDLRYASTLGYNMETLNAYQAVVGWRLGKHVVIRVEYTYQTIDLVRGVTAAIRANARDVHGVAVHAGIAF